jgi:hypothetical protein
MLALFRRRLGGFGNAEVWITFLKSGLAASAMAGLVWGTRLGIQVIGTPAGLAGRLLNVGLPGLVGVIVYFWLAARLRIGEVHLALSLIRKKFKV